jgi:hypothetical protein
MEFKHTFVPIFTPDYDKQVNSYSITSLMRQANDRILLYNCAPAEVARSLSANQHQLSPSIIFALFNPYFGI